MGRKSYGKQKMRKVRERGKEEKRKKRKGRVFILQFCAYRS